MQSRIVGRLMPLPADESALSSLPLCPCPADAPVGVFHVRAGIRHGHTFTPIEVANPCLEPAREIGGLLRCSAGHETDATEEEREDSIAALAAYRRRTAAPRLMSWEDDLDLNAEAMAYEDT
jgi:hypothetical protein